MPGIENSFDRLFWTKFRRLWSRWSDVLVIVKPETAISWHRAGFRLYWRWRSRRRGGRPRVTDEIRGLIRRLAEENRDWGGAFAVYRGLTEALPYHRMFNSPI